MLRILRAGTRLVFVSGNHDSDALERQLARAGAIVLTRAGRLNGDGTTGGRSSRASAALRIAGYDDPLKRLARDALRATAARRRPTPTSRRFAAWLGALRGKVDVVMVHAPALAQARRRRAARRPAGRSRCVIVGATRTRPTLRARTARVTTLNPGSLGGGGTGNLAEGGGDIGLARLIYRSAPRFEPLAADLVQIDPGNGAAQAERHRLDEPAAPAQ